MRPATPADATAPVTAHGSPAATSAIAEDPTGVNLETDRRLAQVTLLVLLVPTVWFARTDLIVGAGSATLLSERFLVRAVFLAALLGGAWRLGRVRERPDYERTMLAIGLVTAASIVLLNLMRPAGSTLPLRTPLMWLLAYYAGLVNRPALQLLPPLLVSASLILLRLFWVNSGESGTIDGDIVVVLVMNVIGVMLVARRDEARQRSARLWDAEREARSALEQTLAELRQLRGIIPICSYCKEVRTQVGDWQALDAYVRTHTQAEFSHGICPNCMTKHHPEVSDVRP